MLDSRQPLEGSDSVHGVVGFFTAVFVTGVTFMFFGLATLTDWRGFGTRVFRWTIRLPLGGFYESWGFSQWKFTMGGVAVLAGVLFSTVAIFNLA